MAAAIVAARSGADVTIIEKNSVLGKKLSMTGNGRCNITNTNISEECYNPSAGKLIRDILSVCPVSEVLDFFKIESAAAGPVARLFTGAAGKTVAVRRGAGRA